MQQQVIGRVRADHKRRRPRIIDTARTVDVMNLRAGRKRMAERLFGA
jgi:hypothetical protein